MCKTSLGSGQPVHFGEFGEQSGSPQYEVE
jgi:hypothetical protein